MPSQDKPEELTVFRCKYCGSVWDEPGHARTCMKGHLHAKDLHVKRVEAKPDGSFYTEEERLPDCLLIGSLELDVESLYIRAGAMLRKQVLPKKEIE